MTHVNHLSRDPAERLAVFVEAGLIHRVPTEWQLLQGQLEMAPYVVLPDAGDDGRYDGAPLGHPLLRTPIVVAQIGWEHFRVGHGLHSSPEALYKHINFVFHEGMPIFDIQLVHTVPNGLAELRRYTQEIEDGATPRRKRQRKLVDLIIPNASAYRQRFLEPGGWIERAEAMDYPRDEEIADFLRPEFCTLVNFVNHCAVAYPETNRAMTGPEMAVQLAKLVSTKLRDQ